MHKYSQANCISDCWTVHTVSVEVSESIQTAFESWIKYCIM